MDGQGIIDGVIGGFITIGALLMLVVWIVVEIALWVFIDNTVKTTEPIQPTIELTIHDGKVDTLYVYDFD